jgi:hypothetical protein
VAILAVDTVAASNLPDPQVIHKIIDRSRKMASPFGGPALLRQHYKDVPLASLGWAIVKADPSVDNSGALPFRWSTLFPRPAVIVASIRYLGSVHVKAEAFTASDDDAAQATQKVATFLTLFRSAQVSLSPSGTDPDVKALFDSLKVEQQKDRAVLTAVAPIQFFHKIFAEPPTGVPASTPPPETSASPATK